MDYSEIAEQLFNLVDNDKDKINSFYDCLNSNGDIQHWFDMNVKDQELKDLYKEGENNQGFYDWISSSDGSEWFNRTPQEITQDNINTIQIPTEKMTDDNTQIHKDIESEDEEIMSDNQKEIKSNMKDGNYSSTKVDDEDELDIALDMLDGSDEDVDVVLDIVDDEDGSDDGSDEDDEHYDSTMLDEPHKKRIHLDHHVNKVVESIDDEEEIDRFVHKKYYVMKQAELGTTEKMNDLEDELDKENISYYDFGKNETIAIKIYTQNEVRLNRIFEKLNFDARCVDIAHYTDDWYSTNDADVNESIKSNLNKVNAQDLSKMADDSMEIPFECPAVERAFERYLGHKITFGEARRFEDEIAETIWLTDDFFSPDYDENELAEITTFNEFKYFTDTTVIGEEAFGSCINLKHIILPNSIKKISTLAFNSCTSLESIEINDECEELEGSTFSQCYNLKRVKLPANLKTLSHDAFFEDRELEEIEYKGKVFGEGQGVELINYLKNNLVCSVKFMDYKTHQYAYRPLEYSVIRSCRKFLSRTTESVSLQGMDTFLNESVKKNIDSASNKQMIDKTSDSLLDEIHLDKKTIKEFFLTKFRDSDVKFDAIWFYPKSETQKAACQSMIFERLDADDECTLFFHYSYWQGDDDLEPKLHFGSLELQMCYYVKDEFGEWQEENDSYYLKVPGIDNDYYQEMTWNDVKNVCNIFINMLKHKGFKFDYIHRDKQPEYLKLLGVNDDMIKAHDNTEEDRKLEAEEETQDV